MIAHENAADSRKVGGAETTKIHTAFIAPNTTESKEKIAIADIVGSLRFIVDNLDDAAREATIAADAISEKNIVVGHYHVARFAAHARAACGAFRDIIGAPSEGEAQ